MGLPWHRTTKPSTIRWTRPPQGRDAADQQQRPSACPRRRPGVGPSPTGSTPSPRSQRFVLARVQRPRGNNGSGGVDLARPAGPGVDRRDVRVPPWSRSGTTSTRWPRARRAPCSARRRMGAGRRRSETAIGRIRQSTKADDTRRSRDSARSPSRRPGRGEQQPEAQDVAAERFRQQHQDPGGEGVEQPYPGRTRSEWRVGQGGQGRHPAGEDGVRRRPGFVGLDAAGGSSSEGCRLGSKLAARPGPTAAAAL